MSPLLNYTTKISPDNTVAQIERILVNNGAKAVLKEYDEDGFISSLAFNVDTPHGEMPIRLPVDVQATLRVLEKQSRTGRLPRHFVNEAQARRIAWRIIKDWIEAQVAILETEMVKLDQIFLPYTIMKSGKTLYEHVVNSKLLLKEPD